MGVPSFNVATSVNLIIAQRLGRKLCSQCRVPFDDIPDKVLTEEGFDDIGIDKPEFTIFKPGTVATAPMAIKAVSASMKH